MSPGTAQLADDQRAYRQLAARVARECSTPVPADGPSQWLEVLDEVLEIAESMRDRPIETRHGRPLTQDAQEAWDIGGLDNASVSEGSIADLAGLRYVYARQVSELEQRSEFSSAWRGGFKFWTTWSVAAEIAAGGPCHRLLDQTHLRAYPEQGIFLATEGVHRWHAIDLCGASPAELPGHPEITVYRSPRPVE